VLPRLHSCVELRLQVTAVHVVRSCVRARCSCAYLKCPCLLMLDMHGACTFCGLPASEICGACTADQNCNCKHLVHVVCSCVRAWCSCAYPKCPCLFMLDMHGACKILWVASVSVLWRLHG
jgi:hypothetical protein